MEHTDRPSTRFTRAVSNLGIWAIALDVIAELNRQEIPVLVLKSLPQIEELYGDVGIRRSNDVDIVVPGERASEALDTVLGLGWGLYDTGWFEALRFAKDRSLAIRRRPWHLGTIRGSLDSNIDLHFDAMDPWIKPGLDREIWQRAELVAGDGVEYFVLSPEDRLLFLSWHFFNDSSVRGMVWDKFRDIEVILERGTDLDWGYLTERARSTGLSISLRLVCDLAWVRSKGAIAPAWRGKLTVSAPLRAALLWAILCRSPERFTRRQGALLLPLLLDRPTVMVPMWRRVLLPDRLQVAADYLGYFPTWPDYVRQLATIYAHRISRQVPHVADQTARLDGWER